MARPEKIDLIEHRLEDLVNQISSLYTLLNRNPYLTPVFTPYLQGALPVSAHLYPPVGFPVRPTLGEKLINFSRGYQPVNYPMNPVNYATWPVNYPMRFAQYPVAPVNYRMRPANHPVRPVNYLPKRVNMPQQETIPLQLRFH